MCSRMKLMLVGQENVGKTSLGKCLLKSNVPERKILKRLLGGVGTAVSPAQPALGATQVSNATLSTDGIDILYISSSLLIRVRVPEGILNCLLGVNTACTWPTQVSNPNNHFHLVYIYYLSLTIFTYDYLGASCRGRSSSVIHCLGLCRSRGVLQHPPIFLVTKVYLHRGVRHEHAKPPRQHPSFWWFSTSHTSTHHTHLHGRPWHGWNGARELLASMHRAVGAPIPCNYSGNSSRRDEFRKGCSY